MAHAKQLEDLKAGWAALAAGEMDKLASFYAEDMIFVLPGQDDVLAGRTAFRAALDGIGHGSMSERLTAPGTWNAIPPLINAARVALDSALVTDQPATRPEA